MPPQRGSLGETFTLGPFAKYGGQVWTRKGAWISSEANYKEKKVSRGGSLTQNCLKC